MPAFAPSLREWPRDGVGLSLAEAVVVVGSTELDVAEASVEAAEGWVLDKLDDDELVLSDAVGKWPGSHSMVPPDRLGRLPIAAICEGAEKATVIVSDADGHVHGSPTVMVYGLAVSSQATLY
jgi:hypothetical protein